MFLHSVQRTRHSQPVLADRHMQVNLRRRDVLVPQQILDLPQIRSIFQQMRRKGMPQRMARHPLLDPRRPCRALDRLVIDWPEQMMASPRGGLRVGGCLLRRTAAARQRFQMHGVKLAERAIA